MRTYVWIFMALLLTIFAGANNHVRQLKDNEAAVSTKDDRVEAQLRRVALIRHIAAQAQREKPSGDVGDVVRGNVKKIVRQAREPKDIFMMAKILDAILEDQSVEDRRYDAVIEAAFWFSVQMLSDSHSIDAGRFLDDLAYGMDAGGKLAIDHYREEYRAMMHRTPNTRKLR